MAATRSSGVPMVARTCEMGISQPFEGSPDILHVEVWIFMFSTCKEEPSEKICVKR
jgi:hypothetical protein